MYQTQRNQTLKNQNSDLDEPNFEESGLDFGSDDDEQNSDKPDSSDELPSVHQPEVLHESLLDDPAPLAALPQDGTITYSKGKSKRGAEQLILSHGFSYKIMRRNMYKIMLGYTFRIH